MLPNASVATGAFVRVSNARMASAAHPIRSICGLKTGVIGVFSTSVVIQCRNVVFDENSMFNPIVKFIVVADSSSVNKQVDQ